MSVFDHLKAALLGVCLVTGLAAVEPAGFGARIVAGAADARAWSQAWKAFHEHLYEITYWDSAQRRRYTWDSFEEFGVLVGRQPLPDAEEAIAAVESLPPDLWQQCDPSAVVDLAAILCRGYDIRNMGWPTALEHDAPISAGLAPVVAARRALVDRIVSLLQRHPRTAVLGFELWSGRHPTAAPERLAAMATTALATAAGEQATLPFGSVDFFARLGLRVGPLPLLSTPSGQLGRLAAAGLVDLQELSGRLPPPAARRLGQVAGWYEQMPDLDRVLADDSPPWQGERVLIDCAWAARRHGQIDAALAPLAEAARRWGVDDARWLVALLADRPEPTADLRRVFAAMAYDRTASNLAARSTVYPELVLPALIAWFGRPADIPNDGRRVAVTRDELAHYYGPNTGQITTLFRWFLLSGRPGAAVAMLRRTALIAALADWDVAATPGHIYGGTVLAYLVTALTHSAEVEREAFLQALGAERDTWGAQLLSALVRGQRAEAYALGGQALAAWRAEAADGRHEALRHLLTATFGLSAIEEFTADAGLVTFLIGGQRAEARAALAKIDQLDPFPADERCIANHGTGWGFGLKAPKYFDEVVVTAEPSLIHDGIRVVQAHLPDDGWPESWTRRCCQHQRPFRGYTAWLLGSATRGDDTDRALGGLLKALAHPDCPPVALEPTVLTILARRWKHEFYEITSGGRDWAADWSRIATPDVFPLIDSAAGPLAQYAIDKGPVAFDDLRRRMIRAGGMQADHIALVADIAAALAAAYRGGAADGDHARIRALLDGQWRATQAGPTWRVYQAMVMTQLAEALSRFSGEHVVLLAPAHHARVVEALSQTTRPPEAYWQAGLALLLHRLDADAPGMAAALPGLVTASPQWPLSVDVPTGPVRRQIDWDAQVLVSLAMLCSDHPATVTADVIARLSDLAGSSALWLARACCEDATSVAQAFVARTAPVEPVCFRLPLSSAQIERAARVADQLSAADRQVWMAMLAAANDLPSVSPAGSLLRLSERLPMRAVADVGTTARLQRCVAEARAAGDRLSWEAAANLLHIGSSSLTGPEDALWPRGTGSARQQTLLRQARLRHGLRSGATQIVRHVYADADAWHPKRSSPELLARGRALQQDLLTAWQGGLVDMRRLARTYADLLPDALGWAQADQLHESKAFVSVWVAAALLADDADAWPSAEPVGLRQPRRMFDARDFGPVLRELCLAADRPLTTMPPADVARFLAADGRLSRWLRQDDSFWQGMLRSELLAIADLDFEQVESWWDDQTPSSLWRRMAEGALAVGNRKLAVACLQRAYPLERRKKYIHRIASQLTDLGATIPPRPAEAVERQPAKKRKPAKKGERRQDKPQDKNAAGKNDDPPTDAVPPQTGDGAEGF